MRSEIVWRSADALMFEEDLYVVEYRLSGDRSYTEWNLQGEYYSPDEAIRAAEDLDAEKISRNGEVQDVWATRVRKVTL